MLSLSEGRNGFGSIDHLLGAGVSNLLGKSAESISTSGVEIQSTGIISKRWFYIEVIRSRDWIEGSIQDITVRKAAESQLRALVDHDHLTGLRNRRGLEVELESAVGRANGGSACAIAYVDIDRFKLINDLHGHAVGDALLQQAAQRLTAAVRASDVVARLADAFVVLFIDCPDYSVAGLSDRILAAISDTPFEIDGRGLSVTASVGVVALDPSMSSIDAVTAADRACAEAKLRGRNCVVRLTERDGQLQTHLEELRVVADLQRRMPTEKFFLVFQPIVALRTPSSSLNYEVLIRMRGEDGKVLPPGNFIGAAERNGLMSQIDRWVLRNTLEWLDSHPEHRDRLSFATINISGASLNDSRFVDDAFAMIAEHPLAMRKLCLEVTESVALHDLGSTRRFVDRLRTYGSKLALDDFGAGYTSFNYLKEIPADFIKIDGTFVKDINRNPANYAITRMIVELTHELGMRSIAEWAETIDTIASLCDLGVDYGQGYGLVRPITADAIAPANSCADLVPDPQVIALLEERARSLPLPQLRRTPQRDLG
jgi:diguanylate cyclase (GGDEF)-like protein